MHSYTRGHGARALRLNLSKTSLVAHGTKFVPRGLNRMTHVYKHLSRHVRRVCWRGFFILKHGALPKKVLANRLGPRNAGAQG